MTWRYQPVWIMSPTMKGRPDEKLFVLIEIYFDDDGKMNSWTLYEKDYRYEPMGDTQQDLIGALALMFNDAQKWEAVEYDKMHVGQEFKKHSQYPHPWNPMTEEEILVAAKADPDAQPLTKEELKRMKRVPIEKWERLNKSK